MTLFTRTILYRGNAIYAFTAEITQENEDMHDVNIRLLLNGMTNYSGGVYNQINHCETIKNYLCKDEAHINDARKQDVIASVSELSSFLSSIAMVGKIEKIQHKGRARRRFTERHYSNGLFD